MKKLRTVTVTEIDEAQEIQVLKAEAARLISKAGETPPSFKVGDVVKITTNRRRAVSRGTTAVIFRDPDGIGEYGLVYLTSAGDLAQCSLRRNEMQLHDHQQKLLTPPKLAVAN